MTPTTSPRPSLLDRSPPLPGLALADLSDDERQQGEGTAAHPCGEFSAARFAALYPERYELIARALLEGFSLDACARVFHIHERTAAAVREREARSLSAESYRGIQARRCRAAVMQATDILLERMREDPKSITPRDLAAVMREAHNIERSLEGAPSQVVGVIRADGASAALADLLQQAAEAAAARQDGFGRAETPAREARPPVVDAAAEVVADGASALPSHGFGAQVIDNSSGVTARATDSGVTPGTVGAPGAALGPRSTGAGGEGARRWAPFREDRSTPENFRPADETPQESQS